MLLCHDLVLQKYIIPAPAHKITSVLTHPVFLKKELVKLELELAAHSSLV